MTLDFHELALRPKQNNRLGHQTLKCRQTEQLLKLPSLITYLGWTQRPHKSSQCHHRISGATSIVLSISGFSFLV